MKSANINLHPLALAAVVFVAVVLALKLLLGRQPGAAVGDAAERVADQTAAAKTQTQKPTPAEAKAKADATRRVMNQVINSAVFQGVPVLQ
ncbi:MAG: hypothetical protein OXU71_09250 [Gammaproteobacteria bacterium]|nr:hypothetical protein [Gammaproteobacteria bacterium]